MNTGDSLETLFTKKIIDKHLEKFSENVTWVQFFEDTV